VTAASRAQLPPDGRSAGLARRRVRAACIAADLESVLDDALLLVTELVTNAIVHAGTDLALRLDTSDGGLRVEVVDSTPGHLLRPQPLDDAREGGRGLFLLDALASSWGSTHTRAGKAVWFHLDTADADPSRRESGPDPALAPENPGEAPAELGADDWKWLLEAIDHDVELTPQQLVRELLHRLAEGLGLEDAALLQPGLDDGEWQVEDAVGLPPSDADVAAIHRVASGRLARHGDDLVLPLRPVGAVVLTRAAAVLDSSRTALARLAADRLGAVLQDERARAAHMRDRGSLALLAEASELFAGALDVTLATTLLAQLVVPRFGSWAAVYGVSGQDPQLLSCAHVHEDRGDRLRDTLRTEDAMDLASDLAGRLATHATVLLGPQDLPESFSGLDVGEVIAVTLSARRRILGVLLVAQPVSSRHTPEDISVLLGLARRAALAVDGARLYEERTAIAKALQSSLLPPELPSVPWLELGARYVAAGEGNDVGGDFYDVFPLPDGGWAVAIGDVCGKGAEAAAITGLARNILRLLLEEGRSIDEAFRRLNRSILELGDRGRFLTASVAVLRPHDGGVRADIASAGHPPAAVVSPDGAVQFVQARGTLLGVADEVDVSVETISLRDGERIVLYTDGVTERHRGDHWFGEETLTGALKETSSWPADAVAGYVVQAVQAFAPTVAQDDLAIVVVGARASG
jgi:sigma-B regulation protein RsbU (phosphoserine phosphatase)